MTYIVQAAALLFYYAFFTPLALVARQVSKDPLRLVPEPELEPEATSFWIVRTGGNYRPMTRQY